MGPEAPNDHESQPDTSHMPSHVSAEQGNFHVPLLEDAEGSAVNSWVSSMDNLSPSARAALGLDSSEGSAAGAVARPLLETGSVGGSVTSGDADILAASARAALVLASPEGSATSAVARPLPETGSVGGSFASGDADILVAAAAAPQGGDDGDDDSEFDDDDDIPLV